MCGFVGLFNPHDVPLSRLSLLKTQSVDELSQGMLSLIYHRGPDEMGVLQSPTGFIASARLSIIDLEHGAQPLSNEDRSLWIVYNGEIYDSEALAASLKARGHTFETRADTEVIVHLFEEYGDAFTDHLNGEYAFALWDRRQNALTLARDRFGTKPLYYRLLGDGAVLFASEIKPLLWATGNVQPRLSKLGIAQTLENWTAVPPETSFEHIYQLQPGHLARFDRAGGPKLINFTATKWARSDIARTPEALESVLATAVKRRLVADVPVGVYLSGGLDSSLVTALASKFYGQKLKTFSIAFDDPQFDESAAQMSLSAVLGTDHTSIRIRGADIVTNFGEAVLAAETAVFRSAFVPMFLLSKLVSEQNVKVVLCGEGADELFGGYDLFKELLLLTEWNRRKDTDQFLTGLQRLYPYLPQFQGDRRRTLIPFYNAFADRLDAPFSGHAIRWSNYSFLSRLLVDAPPSPSKGALESLLASFSARDAEDECRLTEIFTLMHGYLLSTQGDRMTMAHSVESRLPFLDVDAVEFASGLSLSQLIPNLQEKNLLYRLGEKVLPTEYRLKPKTPFLAPDAELFFQPAHHDAWRPYFSKAAVDAAQIFDSNEVANFVARLEAQVARRAPFSRRDNSAFFTILSTLMLRQEIGGRLRPQPVGEKLRKRIQVS